LASIASAAFSRRALKSSVFSTVERGGAVDVRPAKVGHNVAGIELVGFLGRLEVRPVVRRLQEAAELALLVVELLDLRNRVVRRAAHDAAGLDEVVDRVVPGEG
jgi:hypothetical protein